MLFVTYWELNENMPEQERLQASQKVMTSGLFPPKGLKILRWDGTSDGWGIMVVEAESEADVIRGNAMWRSAATGFFKSIKTAPAMPIQEMVPMLAEVTQSVASS